MTLKILIEHSFAKASLAIQFEAPTPGVIALFGPSGAGKSSTMLAIAGLLRARTSRIELDNEPLHKLRTEQRGIGYVFQEGRLFPHLTVAGNLAYGARRVGRGRIRRDDVIALLGLNTFLDRRPHTLSGGERQRVAIGRALLSQPRLLLMDEPLTALDADRRGEILPYLARLRHEFRIPILYASHAADEVMRLADTLVLIDGGRVRACGPLGKVATDVELPLAGREGAAGVLRGTIASHAPDRGLSVIACGSDLILVPLIRADIGTHVRLLVPAREVILALDAPRAISVNNCVPAIVIGTAEDPSTHAALISLEMGGGQLLARVTIDAARRLGLGPGRQVLALIKAMSVELLQE